METDQPHNRPRIEVRTIDRRKSESTWLTRFARDVKTTNGEDGVIEKIFDVVGVENKFLVDFGAADGEYFSNSFNLLQNHGWSGLLLEPGGQYPALEKLYRDRPDVTTIEGIVGFSDDDNLDAHLSRLSQPAPHDFDFLSIDIDGNDVHVWSDIKAFRPRVVCIEFNHFIPLDTFLLQPRDLNVAIGSSLLATSEIARELGYELVAVCGPNAFFVEQSLFSKFEINDNSVEAMYYMGGRETKILQAFDGTILLAGLTTNPWKGYTLDEERMQVLPSNMRQWKFENRKIWPTKKL